RPPPPSTASRIHRRRASSSICALSTPSVPQYAAVSRSTTSRRRSVRPVPSQGETQGRSRSAGARPWCSSASAGWPGAAPPSGSIRAARWPRSRYAWTSASTRAWNAAASGSAASSAPSPVAARSAPSGRSRSKYARQLGATADGSRRNVSQSASTKGRLPGSGSGSSRGADGVTRREAEGCSAAPPRRSSRGRAALGARLPLHVARRIGPVGEPRAQLGHVTILQGASGPAPLGQVRPAERRGQVGQRVPARTVGELRHQQRLNRRQHAPARIGDQRQEPRRADGGLEALQGAQAVGLTPQVDQRLPQELRKVALLLNELLQVLGTRPTGRGAERPGLAGEDSIVAGGQL